MSALLIAGAAWAAGPAGGVLHDCRTRFRSDGAVMRCVQAQHRRAAQRLGSAERRGAAVAARQARERHRPGILHEFHAGQTEHVRMRTAICGRQPAGMRRTACEADLNYSRIDELAHRVR
ncbi:MAG: hypothetical protein ACTHL1_01315 [Burkholderiaceae bacterium]